MKKRITSKEVITYILSLERVGCHPFKYLTEDIFKQYCWYNLKEINLKDLDLTQVDGYSSNSKRRIDRKVKDLTERYKYYKVYNESLIYKKPIILTHNYALLDGFHRLAYFRDNNKDSILAYVGEYNAL